MFIHYFTSVYKLPQIRKFLFYISIGSSLLISFAKNKAIPVKIEQKKGHSKITFSYKNSTKTLLVPTRRKITMKRHCSKYYLVTNNKRSLIQVSQEFPILVSANDLGGDSIEVTDLHGKIIETYSSKETPIF